MAHTGEVDAEQAGARSAELPRLNKLVLIGVGLIGGSFALGVKRAGVVQQVVGWERSATALHRALELGIIDQAADSLAQAMAGADLVVLAAPVAQTGPILRALLPHLETQTIISDCGSTKQDVVQVAREVLAQRVAQFVPAHPIAGRESNGPDAALAQLFEGKKVVLTPLPENSAAAQELVALAWRACGALIHTLSPFEHDRVFAAVSHLPHFLAFALVDLLARQAHAPQLFNYAASGFRDFTRIAASSPEMWRDISLANQDALLHELDGYLAQLQQMRAALQAGDGAQLHALYSNAQHARQSWQKTIEAAEKPGVT